MNCKKEMVLDCKEQPVEWVKTTDKERISREFCYGSLIIKRRDPDESGRVYLDLFLKLRGGEDMGREHLLVSSTDAVVIHESAHMFNSIFTKIYNRVPGTL